MPCSEMKGLSSLQLDGPLILLTISPLLRLQSPAGNGSVVVISALPYPTQQLRSEEHTSELQSLMRISYAVFCLKKKTPPTKQQDPDDDQHKTAHHHTLTQTHIA